MKSGAMPLVSVIIPAYNQGTLLARAIDSALAQTYPAVEVIVVNDGSPDEVTRSTALSYGDRITYIERANGGVAAARNSGIEQASGELIALLDQDDVWLPDKIAKQVAALLAHPDVALVHSSYYLIDAGGRRTGMRQLQEGKWKPLPGLLLDVPVSSCTTLFTRQLLTEVGPFDTALNGSDDWDMWLRMALRRNQFYCIAEPLAEYRVHAGMTSQDSLMMARTGLAVLDKFYAMQSLPDVANEWKNRAYFNKRAWAVSVYYGLGRLDEAREELQAAALLYPEGIATGHFIRSLVSARAEAEQMQATQRMVREAVAFLLKEAKVSTRLASRLRQRTRLILALHAPGGRSNVVKSAAMAFLREPRLIVDEEIWSAARRLARRIIRLRIGGTA